jgi:hypothetical protein
MPEATAALSPSLGALAYFMNSGGLHGILEKLKLSQPYSLTLGGKKIIDGVVTIELPESAIEGIVGTFKDSIRSSIRLGSTTSLQLSTVAGTLIDQTIDQLPDVLGRDQWKKALTGTLQDVVPWLDGSNLNAIGTFIFSIEFLRYM